MARLPDSTFPSLPLLKPFQPYLSESSRAGTYSQTLEELISHYSIVMTGADPANQSWKELPLLIKTGNLKMLEQ